MLCNHFSGFMSELTEYKQINIKNYGKDYWN